MDSITVGLGSRSYDIAILDGALSDAAAHLVRFAARGRMAIVTDEHVAQAVLPRIRSSLEAAGIALDVLTLPAGEATKSWAELARVTDWMLAAGIERSDHVVALGGGVIGDLTGFAAAILKRGCRFVQIPTTLLAQVDSSVGGKTAINAPAGKNMIGAFHQPAFVLIDTASLTTLPPRDLRAGYAEVVKYGLIDDPAFFGWCEAHGAALLAGDSAARHHAIATSVAAKARVVASDERETMDVRALLNLGHTFGHALEAATGFSERLLHGEAVAAGMALALRFSAARGHCPPADAERVTAHLASVGLPTGLASAGVDAPADELAAHMVHDKKARGGSVPFILARGIGAAYVDSAVDLADVAAFLASDRG